MKPRRAGWLALIPMAIAGLFYAATICPTIYFGDGPELTAAAWSLGVAHPTGYPLYMLLGRLFLSLPLGVPGWRMNLLSAVSLLVATGLIYGLAGDWLDAVKRRRRADETADARAEARSRLSRVLFQIGAATAFALSLFVWRHAVQAEVYGAFMALFAAALWALARALDSRKDRTVLGAFFLYGLAWQGHLLAVILAPAFALLALRMALNRRFAALALAIGVFAIGIAGYAYLPIRARAHPPMNWGAPQTLAGLKAHLAGGQFTQTRILTDPATLQPLRGKALRRHLQTQSLRITAWPAIQFNAPALSPITFQESPPSPLDVLAGSLLWLLALIGLARMGVKRPWTAAALGLALGCGIGVLLLYTIADIETYFLPIWPIVLLLAGVAVGWLAAPRKALHSPVAAILMIALAAMGARQNYDACDLSGYRAAETYGVRLLDPAVVPRDAILLLQGDGATFIAWYMQTVEGLRPDVTLFGTNFMVHSWYRHYFDDPRHADFVFYARDARPHNQSDFFVALGGGVIIPNIQRRPVLAVPADPWLQTVLMDNWHGEIVRRLLPPDTPRPPIPAALPSPTLIRLYDNRPYREFQQKQFEEMYGSENLVRGGRQSVPN